MSSLILEHQKKLKELNDLINIHFQKLFHLCHISRLFKSYSQAVLTLLSFKHNLLLLKLHSYKIFEERNMLLIRKNKLYGLFLFYLDLHWEWMTTLMERNGLGLLSGAPDNFLFDFHSFESFHTGIMPLISIQYLILHLGLAVLNNQLFLKGIQLAGIALLNNYFGHPLACELFGVCEHRQEHDPNLLIRKPHFRMEFIHQPHDVEFVIILFFAAHLQSDYTARIIINTEVDSASFAIEHGDDSLSDDSFDLNVLDRIGIVLHLNGEALFLEYFILKQVSPAAQTLHQLYIYPFDCKLAMNYSRQREQRGRSKPPVHVREGQGWLISQLLMFFQHFEKQPDLKTVLAYYSSLLAQDKQSAKAKERINKLKREEKELDRANQEFSTRKGSIRFYKETELLRKQAFQLRKNREKISVELETKKRQLQDVRENILLRQRQELLK